MRRRLLVLGMMIVAGMLPWLLSPMPFAVHAQQVTTSGGGTVATGSSSPVVQQPGDTNVTILNTSTNVITGTLTATRTWTLPAASTLASGREIKVTDVTGAVATPGNNVIIAGNGSDTINGRPTYPLMATYGSAAFMSNGTNGWAVSANAADVPNSTSITGINQVGANQGPLVIPVISPDPVGYPGAGQGWIYLAAGTNGGTCKLVIRVGLTASSTLVLDNLPGGGFTNSGIHC